MEAPAPGACWNSVRLTTTRPYKNTYSCLELRWGPLQRGQRNVPTSGVQEVERHHYAMYTLALAKSEVGSARKLAGGRLKDAGERHRHGKKGGWHGWFTAPAQLQSGEEEMRKLSFRRRGRAETQEQKLAGAKAEFRASSERLSTPKAASLEEGRAQRRNRQCWAWQAARPRNGTHKAEAELGRRKTRKSPEQGQKPERGAVAP